MFVLFLQYHSFTYTVCWSIVFNSGFLEGKLTNEFQSVLTNGEEKPQPLPRRVIKLTDDFDLFHIVLSYIYTDRICFSTTPETAQLSDIPITGNAEGIYALSHRLLLDSLSSKALHFLESTCTAHNITARVFGSFCSVYDEVGKLYHNYFMKNWNRIIQTPEFEGFLRTLNEDSTDYFQLRKMMRSRKQQMENEIPKPHDWDTMQMYRSFLCTLSFSRPPLTYPYQSKVKGSRSVTTCL